MKTIYRGIENKIGRETTSVPCDCGGYTKETEANQEEIKSDHNCGRSYACCVRVFKCIICGKRIACHLEAPEME